MSGLDGLGWPNPEDEPKPKKTMNSQLEIKLAPTPESDKAKIAFTSLFANDDAYWIPYKVGIKLERERDELREWASVNGVSSLAKDRDQFRARLREEQQLHVQTLNERDEWKAKYIQQNKDLGCEMMDPNGTIWDYAKKLQKDIEAINDRRDNFEERLRVELGGHPDSELWGDAGLIAATMRCVDALDVVTEQREGIPTASCGVTPD